MENQQQQLVAEKIFGTLDGLSSEEAVQVLLQAECVMSLSDDPDASVYLDLFKGGFATVSKNTDGEFALTPTGVGKMRAASIIKQVAKQ